MVSTYQNKDINTMCKPDITGIHNNSIQYPWPCTEHKSDHLSFDDLECFCEYHLKELSQSVQSKIKLRNRYCFSHRCFIFSQNIHLFFWYILDATLSNQISVLVNWSNWSCICRMYTFYDVSLLNILTHTKWFGPMRNE